MLNCRLEPGKLRSGVSSTYVSQTLVDPQEDLVEPRVNGDLASFHILVDLFVGIRRSLRNPLCSAHHQVRVLGFVSSPHQVAAVALVEFHEPISLRVIELSDRCSVLAVETRMVALTEQVELFGHLGQIVLERVEDHCELSFVLLQVE